jgi:hypothetical protein
VQHDLSPPKIQSHAGRRVSETRLSSSRPHFENRQTVAASENIIPQKIMKTPFNKKYPSLDSHAGVLALLKTGRKPAQQKLLDKIRPRRPSQIPQQWPRQ